MLERDNQELAKLKQNLVRDQRQQDLIDSQVENIREQLERIAEDSIAKYHREIEATRPEARVAIDQIIQPWFSNLITSGTYTELLSWCRAHEKGIRLTDTIMYFWPKNALKIPDEAESKPYSYTAKFVVEQYKSRDIEKGIQVQADGDEVWYTGFDLFSHKWNKSEGVRIWRQPVVGMGFGFAIISSQYDTFVHAQNVVASLDRISPEVWIKFGQQVESGKVWEVISQSMKHRQIRVLTPEESERRREEDGKKANEYLSNRQWH